MTFKAKKMEEDALMLEKEAKEAEKELNRLKLKHASEKTSEGIKKGVKQAFNRLGGVSEAQQLSKELKEEKEKFEQLYSEALAMGKDRDRFKIALQSEYDKTKQLTRDNEQKNREIKRLSNLNDKVYEENEKIHNNFNFTVQLLRQVVTGEKTPTDIKNFLQRNRRALPQDPNQEQKKGRGQGI